MMDLTCTLSHLKYFSAGNFYVTKFVIFEKNILHNPFWTKKNVFLTKIQEWYLYFININHSLALSEMENIQIYIILKAQVWSTEIEMWMGNIINIFCMVVLCNNIRSPLKCLQQDNAFMIRYIFEIHNSIHNKITDGNCYKTSRVEFNSW